MPGKHTQTAIDRQALEMALRRRTGAQIVAWKGNRAHVREPGDKLSLASILLARRVEEDGSWWTEVGPLCGFLTEAQPPPVHFASA